MERWTHWVLHHRWPVLLGWAALLAVGLASAPRAVDRLGFDFTVPSQPAYRAADEIVATHGNGGAHDPLVLVATGPAAQQAATMAAERARAALPGADVVVPTDAPALTSSDGQHAFALVFPRPAPGYDPYIASRPVVTAIAAASSNGGTTVRALDYAGLSDSGDGGADRGLLVEVLLGAIGALVVLALVFSCVLALAPLVVAAVSIAATFLALLGLTQITDVSFIVQYLVALIGLGVAIDYALLLAMRWREELSGGLDNEQAIVRAMSTAGHSVLVSGLTVAVSLATLVAVPVPFLRSVGYGGLLIPLMSVATCLSLLPAVLSLGGRRLLWPHRAVGTPRSRLWAGLARLTLRHRWVSVGAAAVVLLALAWPVLDIRLGSPPVASVAHGSSGRVVQQAADAGLPLGAFRPIEVLTRADRAETTRRSLAAAPGVGAVVVMPSRTGVDTVRLLVLTRQDAASPEGRDVLAAVRALPGTKVAGTPALDADFVTATYRDGAWALVVVGVATFLLLARALRSLWLPLKALLLNAVSIAAAYGVTTFVWQHGHGTDLLFDTRATGAITTWVPVAAFAFLFGLSMDYEVFILSRMREAWDEHHDTDTAVVEGIASTGRLVTSGAAILVFAFVALASVPTVEVKILATTLGVGIAIDAFLVRGVLAPALVGVFQTLNWHQPRWLARVTRTSPRDPSAGTA